MSTVLSLPFFLLSLSETVLLCTAIYSTRHRLLFGLSPDQCFQQFCPSVTCDRIDRK